MIRKIFCPILRHSLIVGCSSTTTSGIDVYLAQGDNTNVWADIYNGNLTIHSSANIVGGGKAGEDVRTETVTVEVTTGGYVYVTIRGTIISGIMDNSGAWAVQASISDFDLLISENNIDRLGDIGRSMNKKLSKSKARAHRLRKMQSVVMYPVR